MVLVFFWEWWVMGSVLVPVPGLNGGLGGGVLMVLVLSLVFLLGNGMGGGVGVEEERWGGWVSGHMASFSYLLLPHARTDRQRDRAAHDFLINRHIHIQIDRPTYLRLPASTAKRLVARQTGGRQAGRQAGRRADRHGAHFYKAHYP